MLQLICKKLRLCQHKGKIVQFVPIFSDYTRTCLTVRVVLHVEQNHEFFGCALKPTYFLSHFSIARLYGSLQRQ